jgi:hypothetical protein
VVTRPLSRVLEARTEQGEHVAVVVASEKADDSDRERLVQVAEKLLSAQPAGSLRIRAIASRRDAWLTDLWTTGCASDLVALRWPFRRRLDFVRRIVKALDALHGAGIIHGCLCPATVLLDDNLRPVLSEPAAAPVSSLVERKLDSLGCAAFAAPEVVRGVDADVRSDLWSAGRLLESLLVSDEVALVADCLRLCFAEVRNARFVSAARMDAALEQVSVRLPAGDTSQLPNHPASSLGTRERRGTSMAGVGSPRPSSAEISARERRSVSMPGAIERQPSIPSVIERRASIADSREVAPSPSLRSTLVLGAVGAASSLGLASVLGAEATLAKRALVALAILIVSGLAFASALQRWATPASDRASRRPRNRR